MIVPVEVGSTYTVTEARLKDLNTGFTSTPDFGTQYQERPQFCGPKPMFHTSVSVTNTLGGGTTLVGGEQAARDGNLPGVGPTKFSSIRSQARTSRLRVKHLAW